MRLLYTRSDGRYDLTKDVIGDEIPRYAILSHTWKDGQEVTFADLMKSKNEDDTVIQSREGWQKIRFCAEQAKVDGLDHFWIDTCCIDKSNNTELSEAINSMFRWYQNAEKCYVYLSDVSNNSPIIDHGLAFRQSRWFTRGWTLQELLAPRSVEFFAGDRMRLGDKMSLKQIIHEITGIPIDALCGSNLSDVGVEERFSWANNRQTTREEDGAYCLLGIFGIHMPLIYGEGKDGAMKRLQRKVHKASEDNAAAFVINKENDSHTQEERLRKICTWISAPDPSTNYHKAHKQRQAQTGLWLLQSTKFTEWKKNAGSRVWLYGIPGCGKTILSSTIIEALLQHCHDDARMATAYFYFDFNDIQKQDPQLMLRSILCQLLQRSVIIPSAIEALFSSHDNEQRQLSLHALLDVLIQIMRHFTHVYIVLDALDECTKRQELIDVLARIVGWDLDNLHLLLTSRKERDIETSLETYIEERDRIALRRTLVDKDIQRYVHQRLSDDKDLAKWSKDVTLRQEIESALMGGAHGMFRWAACQLDTLVNCRNRAMLRKSLASLPQTLDQTYDRILCAISKEDSVYAMRILEWLTCAARPLSLEEIAEVVAIDIGREPAYDRDEVLEDPLEALNICSSLVTVTMSEGARGWRPYHETISLAHYSVQEYLMSDSIKQGQAKHYSMQEAECHRTITIGSLKYLTQLQQPMTWKIFEVSALARYAAEFWINHIRKSKGGEDLDLLAMGLLSTDNPAYFNWIRLWDPRCPWDPPNLKRNIDSIPTPIHYTAGLGLTSITKMLLDSGVDLNARTGRYYSNALQTASFNGQKETVELLLDRGADVNLRGGIAGNALHAASNNGHQDIVKLLLDRGADVNARDSSSGYALNAALTGMSTNSRSYWPNFVETILLLLDSGADVEALHGPYGTALEQASMIGHKEVVSLLLGRGANINANSGRALRVASEKGAEEVVTLLLDRGAEINAQNNKSVTALYIAAGSGHKGITTLLLKRGASLKGLGRGSSSALSAAAGQGHVPIVKLLLDAGADPNGLDACHNSALAAAAEEGYQQIVELLLEKGASTDSSGGYYSNALQAAAFGGRTQVLDLLIATGAEMQTQDRYGRSLLWWAAAGGRLDIVIKLVRQYGLDPRVADNFGRTPSWIAGKKGYDVVSKFLAELCGENNVESTASPQSGNQETGMICDVCTLYLREDTVHYHCYTCHGGDWDMCTDCKAMGAMCTESTHTLVKRTFRNKRWVEVL